MLRMEHEQHSDHEQIAADWDRITELGGPIKLAARLRYSVQRVQNWKHRGIPASVKLQHPFLRKKAKQAEKA